MNNKLIHADCLQIFSKLKDNSVDHCITDPPYNISGYDGKKEIGWYKSNKTWKEDKQFNKISEEWDSFTDDEYLNFTKIWLDEVQRVVKPNGNIAIFGTFHNIYKIGYLLSSKKIKINNSIIWYKRNAFPSITRRTYCESTEQIIWAVNNDVYSAKNWVFNYNELKELTENKKQMRNMWDIPMTPKREKTFGKHAAQKPVSVIERLVIGLTNEKDSVIDPFSGSGSIAYVCKKLKRKYLAIEKNIDSYNLSKKRLLSINT